MAEKKAPLPPKIDPATGLWHADALSILVHPLWATTPDLGTESYRARRLELLDKAVERLTPRGRDELTIILPNPSFYKPTEYRPNEVRTNEDQAGAPAWEDLFDALQEHATNPQNVLWVPSFVYPEEDTEYPLLGHLRDHGYFMDRFTDLVVGGEFIDMQVTHVVDDLLSLPEVADIWVDREVSIRQTEYDGFRHSVQEDFYPRLNAVNHADNDYFYVTKR